MQAARGHVRGTLHVTGGRWFDFKVTGHVAAKGRVEKVPDTPSMSTGGNVRRLSYSAPGGVISTVSDALICWSRSGDAMLPS